MIDWFPAAHDPRHADIWEGREHDDFWRIFVMLQSNGIQQECFFCSGSNVKGLSNYFGPLPILKQQQYASCQTRFDFGSSPKPCGRVTLVA